MKRNHACSLVFQVLFALIAAVKCAGSDFVAKIVDGRGRAITNAIVEIEVPRHGPDNKAREAQWLELRSGQDGVVKGRYDEALLPAGKTVTVYVKKEGYAGYSTDRVNDRYVLEREFNAGDVTRIASLPAQLRTEDLADLLAGSFVRERGGEGESLEQSIFFHEQQLRPSLRLLVQDTQVGRKAIELLAFIGVPEDVRLAVQHAPAAKRELFEDRWAYALACAMLEPSTEEEWAFLRRCALNEYEDGWVDGGAIGILRLNAFPRSLEILREASQKNPSRQGEIRQAIEFINSKPPPLTNPDLIEAGRKVAQAIRIGEWQTNRPPTFNRSEDKALIDCEFIAGRDLLVYTATLHKVGDHWRLRGVRETMQALLASPPPKSSFLGAWLGYSSGHLEFARLELLENGTGLFALSELPNTAPGNYRITRWSPEGSKLGVVIETADPEAEAIRLENVLSSGDAIELTVRGVHGDWSRTMTLFRETEFQRRAADVKASLEKLKKGK